MKPKLILGLALVLCGGLFGCSTATKESGLSKANEFVWGEAVGGLQLATSVDRANRIIHCRIRNCTTNEIDYPSFDFGYFEFIHLEIKEGNNWRHATFEHEELVFPRAYGASGGCPTYYKQINQGQIVTNTYTRARYRVRPVQKHEDYLKYTKGDTNEALFVEQINKRLNSRDVLLTKMCSEDTFAIDLTGRSILSDLSGRNFVEARMSQTFRLKKPERMITLYSPVFILDGSLINSCILESRELFGK